MPDRPHLAPSPYRAADLTPPRPPSRSGRAYLVALVLLVAAVTAVHRLRPPKAPPPTRHAIRHVPFPPVSRLVSGDAVTILTGDAAHARFIRVPGAVRRRGVDLVRDAEVIAAPGVVGLVEGGRWAVTAAGQWVELLDQRLGPPLSPPVAARGGRDAIDLVGSDEARCAVSVNGDVSCGDGADNPAYGPHTSALRVPSPEQIVMVPHRSGLVCVRGRNGEVACGDRDEAWVGHLGADENWCQRLPLGDVPRARRVALSDSDLCLVGFDRSLWCLYGPDRPLRRDESPDLHSLTAMHRALGDVEAVALGPDVGCFRRTDGEVGCWGRALADSGVVRRGAPVPIAVPGRTERLAALDGGLFCALAEGRVWCWGAVQTTLGLADSAVPRELRSLAGATGLASMQGALCATLADGTARCTFTETLDLDPSVVAHPAGLALRSLVGAGRFACATDAARRAWCARYIGEGFRRAPSLDGREHFAVLGGLRCDVEGPIPCIGPDRGWRRADPVDPEGEAIDRSFLAALRAPALLERRVVTSLGCAIGSTGAVACQQSDRFNDNLDESATGVDEPVAVVPGLSDAVELAINPWTQCARHRTGRVSCWGENTGLMLSHGEASRWSVGLDELLRRSHLGP